MGGLGEGGVEEVGEEAGLDGRREEGGEDVEACVGAVRGGE